MNDDALIEAMARPMSVFWRHSIRRYLEERGLPPLRRKYR